MQVNTWNAAFNWQVFREKLERLERDLPENQTNLFGKLIQIITPAPEATLNDSLPPVVNAS